MAEAKRLVIFGDSIAKGVMFQDGRYHLCRAHDFDALAQQGVEVRNFAKMGACTDTTRISVYWTVTRNSGPTPPEKLPKDSALPRMPAYFFVKNSQK